MTQQILFVGGGNMGAALIGGLLANGAPAASLCAVEIDAAQRERLAHTFGIKVWSGIADVAQDVDTIVLAVKPQHMRDAAAALRPVLREQLVLSIAAGILTEDLARWLGGYRRIVRVMPNTPALVRAGVSGLFALAEVTAAERSRAEAVLRAVGETLWVAREELIDAVTAVSGSGPAYVFYFIEALRQGALELGFDQAQAQQLVLATFAGAIRLAQTSSEDVTTLRERVTSKGGTTERALATMNGERVAEAIAKAVHAAMQRAGELGQEQGKAL
ncbi:MAG: pyrroline-5-carboxylate reductase [Burkholderiales bacterium]